jgi:hypothetical protein
MSVRALNPAPDYQRVKKRWYVLFGANSLAISILLHLLFGVGATFLIVEHFQKKHINFHASEPPSSQTEIEHKVELAKRNNVESAPPDLKRIVTTDVSAITLPEPPEVPTTDESNPTPMAGVDGVMGSGLGGGASGGGGGNGGGIPEFGSPDGKGLQGYLYDLKQTPDLKPTGMDLHHYYQVLGEFLDHGWNNSVLEKYFKSKNPIYADRLAISSRQSEEAPKAFNLENEVQPALWVIHYHGTVIAPEGDYRFIGFADNVLIVRIGHTTVLDAGWSQLLPDDVLHHDLPFVWSKLYPNETGLLKKGMLFHMDAETPVDMDILIGDDGGLCAFYLLLMKEGNTYDQADDKTPKVPFFQLSTKDAPTFNDDQEHPPYNTKPEPWREVDSFPEP